MKKSKRIIAMILSFAMCLTLLAACGSSGSGGAPTSASGSSNDTSRFDASGGTTSGNTVTEVTPSSANLADHIDIIINDTQITVVNPMIPAGSGGPSMWTYTLVHDKLVAQPSPGVYEPMLAKEWFTDDYKTFTFKLRDDAYFHNGEHFTADDVIWTAQYAKDNPSAPPNSTWRMMDSIKAIDPFTVEIVLNQMYVDFFSDLSGGMSGMLSKKAYEKNPDDPSWGQIGTGPYKVTDFSSNDYCTVERTDSYWGEQPPTKSLTFWTIPELSVRMVMMKNKEAQVSFQMTPEDLDLMETDTDFQILPVMINEPGIIGFNDQGDAIMKDLNFRKAVAYALNYDEIAMVALGHWATASWDGNVWGPDTQYRLEGLPKREQNIALAKECLEQSVYNGETITMITTSPHYIRASEIIQLQLEQVGIKLEVTPTDHAGLVDSLIYNPESKVQLHLFSMAMSHTAAAVFNSLTNRALNRLNCNDPFVYELADKYRATIDEDKRREIAQELQQKYFFEQYAAIAAFWRVQGIAAIKGIGGIKLSTDQFRHDLRNIYWNLDETPAGLRP
ncbi:MAG: ABC transporter substrate-binding protein [Peptococcaceae bacterium]|jgi:peptide/nickel transport system substrate-binding protein|nr:ABC transporter substrate-binding protein [Peptococcaceae bacterium]